MVHYAGGNGRQLMRSLSAVVLAAGIGVAIGLAPPAQAGESEYLGRVQYKLAYLSTDQLLTEGHKVCDLILRGNPSPAAIPMVTKDLQPISVAAAVDII